MVRSSMGGIFKLPVYQGLSLPDIQGILQKSDVILIADSKESAISADSIKSLDYTDLDLTAHSNVVLIIGNEATGISSGLAHVLAGLGKPQQSILRVKIPLANGTESLNCSIACGILGYEIRRQLLLASNHARQMLSLN